MLQPVQLKGVKSFENFSGCLKLRASIVFLNYLSEVSPLLHSWASGAAKTCFNRASLFTHFSSTCFSVDIEITCNLLNWPCVWFFKLYIPSVHYIPPINIFLKTWSQYSHFIFLYLWAYSFSFRFSYCSHDDFSTLTISVKPSKRWNCLSWLEKLARSSQQMFNIKYFLPCEWALLSVAWVNNSSY